MSTEAETIPSRFADEHLEDLRLGPKFALFPLLGGFPNSGDQEVLADLGDGASIDLEFGQDVRGFFVAVGGDADPAIFDAILDVRGVEGAGDPGDGVGRILASLAQVLARRRNGRQITEPTDRGHDAETRDPAHDGASGQTERLAPANRLKIRLTVGATEGGLSVRIDSPPSDSIASRFGPLATSTETGRDGPTRHEPPREIHRPTTARQQAARTGKADGIDPNGQRGEGNEWIESPRPFAKRPPSLPWDHGVCRILRGECYPQSAWFVNRVWRGQRAHGRLRHRRLPSHLIGVARTTWGRRAVRTKKRPAHPEMCGPLGVWDSIV